LNGKIFNMLKKVFDMLRKKPLPQKVHIAEVSHDEKRAVINHCRELFDLDHFVESGTFLGETIEFFKNRFQKLYSIELSEQLAERAQKRFAADRHIRIIQGNSADKLHEIMLELKTPCLFWLDGHYSSEFFYEGEYFETAKAETNTPIEKELDNILCTELNHVILIDDARLFIGELDYPTLQEIEKRVKKYKPLYTVRVISDIIQVLPPLSK